MASIKNNCCFTGHRPKFFMFEKDETHPDCLDIQADINTIFDEYFAWCEKVDSDDLDAAIAAARELIAMAKDIDFGEDGDPDIDIAGDDMVIFTVDGRAELTVQKRRAEKIVLSGHEFRLDGDLDAANAAYDEAIAIYDKVIAAFKVRDDMQNIAVEAMLGKGGVLARWKEDLNAALAVYDEVIDLFKNHEELTVQVEVASAMWSKGETLGDKCDPDAAIAAYRELLDAFDDSTLQKLVSKAMVEKNVAGDEWTDASVFHHKMIIATLKDMSRERIQTQIAKK